VGKLCAALILAANLLIASDAGSSVSADNALKNLLDGNARYRAARLMHPDQTIQRRQELVNSQKPFAVVLGCADSRVPPEIIFDQGLGDLFVIRVAGNIASSDVLGSIEYAVEHLGSKLVVVLGHEKCGAIQAALARNMEGHIRDLVKAIAPAVSAAKKKPGDRVHNCVESNVKSVVHEIEANDRIVHHAVEKNGVKVVGAMYDLETGVVEVLPH
jgi:carbonic anhydrase